MPLRKADPEEGLIKEQMTVNYNLDVSSSTSIGFVRLLFRWRGSVWRSVYKELLIWLVCYYLVFAFYRYALKGKSQESFGELAAMFEKQLTYIPLTFMLGFFVSVIVDRWKQIINNMGWIENNALIITTIFRGTDEESILQRRTLVRYLVLAQILVFRNISMKVRRRFPTYESIIRAGFMSVAEKEELVSVQIPYNKYWVPVQWALVIAQRKMEKEKIQPAFMNTFINELKTFRNNLSYIVNYDWCPIPLAYPQVVFVAVRSYFIVCLICRQYILPPIDEKIKDVHVDIYVPVITILQFIFIIGWMKVAEALLNPLGEDDDDFDCNFLIDKNIATGLAIADFNYDKVPGLQKDRFMGFNFMKPSKWTKDQDLVKGSAAAVELTDSEQSLSTIVSSLATEEGGRERATSTIDAMRHRLGTIFSVSSDHKEFDENGDYSRRYFSQMSRY